MDKNELPKPSSFGLFIAWVDAQKQLSSARCLLVGTYVTSWRRVSGSFLIGPHLLITKNCARSKDLIGPWLCAKF